MSLINHPNRTPSPAGSNRFIVAGISITTLRKQWRPALPTKKQEPTCRVVITASWDSVTFAITGAAINVPALTSGPFVAEVPFSHFKWLLKEPYQDGAMVAFELSSGSFAVSGIAIQSSQIIVEPSEPVKMSAQAAAPPNALGHPQDKNTPPSIANPLDAPIGFPLLGAYRYIRTYGLQRSIASQAFVDEQEEVERLLTKADSLLRPLAITRVDLERLLDAKVGISRPR